MIVQPSYVSFDSKGREALLSQIGTFSPGERELFHRLCRSWESEINYNRFLASASSESATAKSDLEKLLLSLKKEGIGILTTTIKDGLRIPLHIVLTEKKDSRFVQKIIDEAILDVLEEPTLPMPSLEYFQSQNIEIPLEVVNTLGFDELALLLTNKDKPNSTVYMLRVDDKDQYLLASTSVKRFAAAGLYKAQAIFQNGNMLAAAAALLNISLMDAKKNSRTKNHDFWISLSEKMLSQRKALEGHRKLVLPPGIFGLMNFLKSLMEEQRNLAVQAKKAEEDRRIDLQTLAEEVKNSPGHLMTEEAFGTVLQRYKEKYGLEYEEFKQEFEEKYLVVQGKTNLSPIIHIEKNYIHSDNIHGLFLTRIAELTPTLHKIYVALMTSYIKHGGTMSDPVFSSPASFEADITQKIKIEDPVMYQLIQRPQAVAEALISSSKKSHKARSVEDMKLVLASFFYPEQVRFKELAVIFGIDLRDVYQHAFMHISIFRQILLRVTGKHEGFQRQFSEHVQYVYNQVSRKTQASSGEMTSMVPGPARTKTRLSRKTYEPMNKNSAGKNKSKTESNSVKSRNYTQNEREDAWKQFSEKLKK